MALFDEEDRPKRARHFDPPILDRWDVEELRDWIETLKAEIARAEAAIAGKQAQRAAADAFFRKP